MEVYQHYCVANGKSYVGQTSQDMSRRWRLHQHCARSPKTPAYRNLFSKAIRKYGAAGFTGQVLATANSQAELNNLERLWIILLQAKAPTGYNLTDGGDSGTPGHEVKPEVRARLSAAAKAQWQNPDFRKRYSQVRTGKKMAPAAQERRLAALRMALCGKKQSAETIAKRIQKTTGKKRTAEFREACRVRMTGKKMSAETRTNMSVAQLARQARKEKEPDGSTTIAQ